MDIKKLDRKALKSFFVKNAIPTEGNFKDLIDGMLNQKDDGIVKLPDEPLSLQPDGSANSQKKVINFYGSFADPKPAWTLSLNPRVDPNDPASATRPGWSIGDADGNSRLFIDQNTGNVGIGTLDPKAKLDVKGIAKVESAWGVSTDPDSGMSHGGSLLIKSWAPQIDFIDTDYHDWAIHVNSGKMHFIREPWEIALVLDDNGRVGIGTRDPAGKLNIHLGNPQGWDGNIPAIRLTSPDARYYLDVNAYIVAGGNVGYQFSPVANGTANAGLIIDTFGNVGIGTTSPGNLLEIKNSGGTTPGVVIGNGTGRYQLGVGIVTANDGKFGIYDFKGSSNRFVIDTNGNVGIGTSNPTATLEVSGRIKASDICFGSGGWATGDHGGSIELGDSLVAGVTPYIDFHYGTGSQQDHNMRIINDAAGRLSINGGNLVVAGGNVGIGTIDPKVKLHVSSGNNKEVVLKSDGYISLEGATNPAKETGFSNQLTPKNLIKAWGIFNVSRSDETILDGFNVTSVRASATGDNVSVTLTMGVSSWPCIVVTGHDAGGFTYCVIDPQFNPFTIFGWDPSGNRINFKQHGLLRISFIVLGSQT